MNTAQVPLGTGDHRRSGAVAFLMEMALVLGAGSWTAPALAQYRCVQPDGGVSYQQMPCPAAAAGKKMELSSTATSAPGGKEDRTDWASVIRSQPAAGPESASAGPQSRDCPTPQQIKSLEFEASKIANRKNAGMQDRLARARVCQ